MQERAKIFIKKHGEWDTRKFMAWIITMAGRFESKTGKKVKNNQEEFTEYLKGD